jgi:hypothetical protein
VRPGRVNWTYDVHLVVLERNVVLVHVDYVICIVYPESIKKTNKRNELKLLPWSFEKEITHYRTHTQGSRHYT